MIGFFLQARARETWYKNNWYILTGGSFQEGMNEKTRWEKPRRDIFAQENHSYKYNIYLYFYI
jgi:hypothetical protein